MDGVIVGLGDIRMNYISQRQPDWRLIVPAMVMKMVAMVRNERAGMQDIYEIQAAFRLTHNDG